MITDLLKDLIAETQVLITHCGDHDTRKLAGIVGHIARIIHENHPAMSPPGAEAAEPATPPVPPVRSNNSPQMVFRQLDALKEIRAQIDLLIGERATISR